MKLYDDFAGFAVAILISIFGAIATAGAAFLLTIFIGARFFNDELSYGIPFMFGLPAAIIVGVTAFALIFRKIRSL
jgi:hypothetical protein